MNESIGQRFARQWKEEEDKASDHPQPHQPQEGLGDLYKKTLRPALKQNAQKRMRSANAARIPKLFHRQD